MVGMTDLSKRSKHLPFPFCCDKIQWEFVIKLYFKCRITFHMRHVEESLNLISLVNIWGWVGWLGEDFRKKFCYSKTSEIGYLYFIISNKFNRYVNVLLLA